MEMKHHPHLTILRLTQTMKEAHLKEVQEVLLRIHPPLTRWHHHCLLHQQSSLQSSINQQSQIKRNHMSRNQRISRMRNNGTATSGRLLSTSRRTKNISLVTKVLSAFSSVS
jgi:hypothetical protein